MTTNQESNVFFRVVPDDRVFSDRWLLGEPVDNEGSEIDARDLCDYGRYNGPAPRGVPIIRDGTWVAFNFASFDLPIVSDVIANLITSVCPDQVVRFPILIDKRIEGYEVLNIIPAVDCIDYSRSEVNRWTARDGRPEMIGKPRMVLKLRIIPSRVVGLHIFRIADWEAPLLVSDRLRRILEPIRLLGVTFQLVT